ncbi:response regulator transcription factor [Paenibacillus aceris]|uniref:Two-component system response regulator YesN n=1 Tax=Paenibacillus aceris TaxID=869555 RepID=A0ABS4HUJ7_9BACL|nr:response regulator [Paenibacillus aceris]MBP1962290.1 two-component system response regulator YesN [Paenibacillus aceris]NHW37116.1 response regulator [Paenibacillus aceris]
MYRLLVVDDMPIVADGLVGLLQDTTHLNLKLYKAYSGTKALDILRSEEIDIVLSDIRMPGMQGIDLLKEIRVSWPNCKVIFLTAYDDFEYVRSVISLGGFEYILKIEGDDKIVQTVEKAIYSLNEENVVKTLIHGADKQVTLTDITSQEAFVWELLSEAETSENDVIQVLSEMNLPVRADLPLQMVLGDVREWDSIMDQDKAGQLSVIQNIIEEYTSQCARLISMCSKDSQLLLLIQPYGCESDGNETVSFIRSALEPIRQTCRKLLDIRIDLALQSLPAGWCGLHQAFEDLRGALFHGTSVYSETTEMTAFAVTAIRQDTDETKAECGSDYFQLYKVRLLDNYLQNGNEADFFKLFHEWKAFLVADSTFRLHKLECLHALHAIFESNMVACKMTEELETALEQYNKIQLGEISSWEKLQQQYRQMASAIFEHKRTISSGNAQEWIDKVNAYIEAHLAEDLTLPKLAAQVSFNPSYFSRFYKQTTGISLSDYIADIRNTKAKELLKGNKLKIQDIAMKAGYQSSMAFIRFFKKQNRMTPQEFRRKMSSTERE